MNLPNPQCDLHLLFRILVKSSNSVALQQTQQVFFFLEVFGEVSMYIFVYTQ